MSNIYLAIVMVKMILHHGLKLASDPSALISIPKIPFAVFYQVKFETRVSEDFFKICFLVYAQVCSKTLRRHLGQWRSDDFCPVTCPDGFIFSECGSLCPATCQSPVPNILDSYCTSDCFPTCVCPDGLVENDGKCIEKKECPCIHQNNWYDSGWFSIGQRKSATTRR